MHVTLARELAEQLNYDAAKTEAGAYYLGATTPDIRVLTRWDREKTHFFDLNNFEEQRSVENLFREQPELASPEGESKSVAAFLCGYISHLEIDEAWIVDIYRPCFGEGSPLKGDVFANLLDRVLQFELDRRHRGDPSVMPEIHDDLLNATVDQAIGFIDKETLLRWRDVSADVVSREPTWDRFGVLASRHLRAYGVESEADLAHFLDNIPDLLDQAIRAVTPERMEAFQEKAHQRALDAMRKYIS
jgi:hypothetical protein